MEAKQAFQALTEARAGASSQVCGGLALNVYWTMPSCCFLATSSAFESWHEQPCQKDKYCL